MTTLPQKARQKFAVLKEELDGAQALVNSTLARIAETNRVLGYDPEKTADLEFELTRLRANLGKYQQRFEGLSSLVANIRHVIGELKPNVVLSDWKPGKLKERSGETVFDAIDRTRTEIADKARELRDVRDAGLPVDELRAQAAKWVQTQALRCTPKITASQREFKIEFGQQTSFTTPPPDLPAFLCWLDPDAVLELLTKQIDALPVPKLVLTPAERDHKLVETKEALLRLERIEEELIWQSEQDHEQKIYRRPAADPLAVLGIVVERAAKAVA
jgi:hypothetical protein